MLALDAGIIIESLIEGVSSCGGGLSSVRSFGSVSPGPSFPLYLRLFSPR